MWVKVAGIETKIASVRFEVASIAARKERKGREKGNVKIAET